MKKKICIVTGNRADYYLLKPIILSIQNINEITLKLVVTGTHLSSNYGNTYKDIEKDGIIISKKIEILLNSDSPAAINKAMSLAMISFCEYFSEENFDMIILLGDRFEIFAAAISANLAHILISHIYGGEITIGASDEGFRHCITKLSHLHFTSTEAYRNRVIQLGEDPKRVFNVGSIGVENIKNIRLFSKEELESTLNFDLKSPYALITFHPETLEDDTYIKHLEILLNALDEIKSLRLIFTKANGDCGSNYINARLQKYCTKNHQRAILFDSLGATKYLSAMKYASIVIGNSSSGIIEAPSFNIPTINIGDRQKGRIQSNSVINCDYNKLSLVSSINSALAVKLSSIINPYEKENTSKNIVTRILQHLQKTIDIKKEFFDIK